MEQKLKVIFAAAFKADGEVAQAALTDGQAAIRVLTSRALSALESSICFRSATFYQN